jgi:microcystin-dependent protein
MPGTPGARTGLATILTGDAATAFRTTINSVITWLEANATLSSAGLLSDRPVSTSSTPGIPNRKYYATDLGLEFRDTGTSWVPIGIPIGGGFEWVATADLTPELVIEDGRPLSRTTYSALWNQIRNGHAGTVGDPAPYGNGDGSTTFTIPNSAGRIAVGLGTHASVNALGKTEGAAAANRSPLHNHGAHHHDQAPMGVGGNAGVIGDNTDRPHVVQGNSISGTRQSGANVTADATVGDSTGPTNGPAFVVKTKIIRII